MIRSGETRAPVSAASRDGFDDGERSHGVLDGNQRNFASCDDGAEMPELLDQRICRGHIRPRHGRAAHTNRLRPDTTTAPWWARRAIPWCRRTDSKAGPASDRRRSRPTTVPSSTAPASHRTALSYRSRHPRIATAGPRYPRRQSPRLAGGHGLDLCYLAADEAQIVDVMHQIDQQRPPPASRRHATSK